jgi:hypothetical protein
MLLVKLGILAFMGKSFYSSFLVVNIYHHITHSLKLKLREVVK